MSRAENLKVFNGKKLPYERAIDMKKISKILLGITAAVTLVGSAVTVACIKSDNFFYKSKPYSHDEALTITKKENEDFVILQLADVQIGNEGNKYPETEQYEMIDDLINRSDPDFIVLTGDNALYDDLEKIENFADFLNSYNIPFSFVFGNHENDIKPSLREIASVFEKKENCLFREGFKNVSGVGNYVVNVVENSDIKYSFYMFDSHNYGFYLPSDKKQPLGGTDWAYIKKSQIDWYERTVKAINAAAGHPVDSLAFFHIPLPEYRYFTPEQAIIGEQREDICSPYKNTGLFAKMEELGSTKGVFVGHDHKNNFAFEYDSIVLAYGLKTGRTSYYDEDLQGALVIRFDKDMKDFTIEHLYSEFN